MATAGSMLANVRQVIGDPDRDYVTDAVGLEWLSKAQEEFCDEVLPLDEFKAYAVTAKKVRFDLPTDAIIVMRLMWYQTRTEKLRYLGPHKFAEYEESFPNSTGSPPDHYTMERRQIVVGPQVPQTNSATALASGNIASTATLLGLTAASGTFRSKGFVIIGSEVIEFHALATTTLTPVTRGMFGTSPASIASGAQVTQVDMIAAYRKIPAALTATTASPEIPVVWHRHLEQYLLYLAWLARGDKDKAQLAMAEYQDMKKRAMKTAGRRTRDGMLAIQERIRRVW